MTAETNIMVHQDVVIIEWLAPARNGSVVRLAIDTKFLAMDWSCRIADKFKSSGSQDLPEDLTDALDMIGIQRQAPA